MRKTSVSIMMVSAFALYLAAPQLAQSDESRAGTYNNTVTPAPVTSGAMSQPSTAGQQPGSLGNSDDIAASRSNDLNTTPTTMGQQPGTMDAVSPMSTADQSDVGPSHLQKEGVAFQPQVGAINYKDTNNVVSNRALYGLIADTNMARYVTSAPQAYIGPQIGLFFSHLGGNNANFLGSPGDSSANLQGDPGANMFYIPTDLKIGYNIGNFRPSVHAGANLFYRSVSSAMALGTSADTASDSGWKYLPNLGVDLEYAFTRNFAIVARPDITFSGSNRVWTASIGASIPLG